MTDLIVKLFIKNNKDIEKTEVRTAYGVVAGIVGVICNLILFVMKLIIGMFLNSVAIIADAFNNLSDAASSVIGMIGAKLAAKPADAEHPFGHGRYEYISALIVSFLILEVAFSCFKDSFSKILHPENIDFNLVSVIILSVSILVKLWLSFFNRKLGKRIDSKVMLATSKDAMGDCIVTGATILSLLCIYFLDLNIDGIVGCLVSLIVFIAGINVARDTIEPLLGEAVPSEMYKEICSFVESYEGIEGTHDLIVHSYGPSRKMATIHAEVRNDENIDTAHENIDRIEKEIIEKMGIFLVIHMDPIDVKSDHVKKYRDLVKSVISEINNNVSIHDFRMVDGKKQKNLVFDMVVPFSFSPEEKLSLQNEIVKKVKEKDKRLNCVINVENSFEGSGT